MTASEISSVIAAATALFAVMLGPLVSLSVANKQARISVRSNNRQAWINSLRDVVAEFSATVRAISMNEEFEDVYPRAEKLFFLEEKTRLLINPKETDHQKLVELMHESRKAIVEIYRAEKKSGSSIYEQDLMKTILTELIQIAQRILKREWERVKRAE